MACRTEPELRDRRRLIKLSRAQHETEVRLKIRPIPLYAAGTAAPTEIITLVVIPRLANEVYIYLPDIIKVLKLVLSPSKGHFSSEAKCIIQNQINSLHASTLKPSDEELKLLWQPRDHAARFPKGVKIFKWSIFEQALRAVISRCVSIPDFSALFILTRLF